MSKIRFFQLDDSINLTDAYVVATQNIGIDGNGEPIWKDVKIPVADIISGGGSTSVFIIKIGDANPLRDGLTPSEEFENGNDFEIDSLIGFDIVSLRQSSQIILPEIGGYSWDKDTGLLQFDYSIEDSNLYITAIKN